MRSALQSESNYWLRCYRTPNLYGSPVTEPPSNFGPRQSLYFQFQDEREIGLALNGECDIDISYELPSAKTPESKF